jgi:hypothetical protein
MHILRAQGIPRIRPSELWARNKLMLRKRRSSGAALIRRNKYALMMSILVEAVAETTSTTQQHHLAASEILAMNEERHALPTPESAFHRTAGRRAGSAVLLKSTSTPEAHILEITPHLMCKQWSAASTHASSSTGRGVVLLTRCQPGRNSARTHNLQRHRSRAGARKLSRM